MALTIQQRKNRLPRGAQQAVADEMKMNKSFISLVVAGRAQNYDAAKVRDAQRRLAERMAPPVDVTIAFGPSAAEGAELYKAGEEVAA